MSIIAIPNIFTVGAVIVASQHNSNFSTIYNDYNGSISTSNLSASAGILDTQLAPIATAGKVSGSALVTLGSVPSGAGALPSKNGGTGADLSAATQGAIPYFSATGVESALTAGTAGQALISGGASANPSWGTAVWGSPITVNDQSAHQAATDGLLICQVEGTGSNWVAQVFTDASTNPTTAKVRVGNAVAANNVGMISYPIKSGNYYKVTLTNCSFDVYEFWPK